MTRLARVVFVLLVGATFAAFFVAQRVKSAPPVVSVGRLTEYFSPNGDGRRDVNDISVRLAEDDEVTVSIVEAGGDEVRRLATGVPVKAYRPLRLAWRGRTDAGGIAEDGIYRVAIRLRRQNRSVVVQRAIRLDVTPPRPAVREVEPFLVAPGERAARLRLRGVSSRRRTRLSVWRTDARPAREVARFTVAKGRRRARWDGCWRPEDPRRAACEEGGAPAPEATYLVQIAVEDRAGNVGVVPAGVPPGDGEVRGRPGVTVRALAVQPPLRPIRGGERARFFVDARGRPYDWSVRRLGQSGRQPRGRERSPRLDLSAPRGRAGLYLLQVRAGEDETRVPFAVSARERSPLLVVLPSVTWVGTVEVDDDRDGLPDTLVRGESAAHPRVFPDGLPPGIEDGIAPLLVFLDRAGIPYDVTTDLALAEDGALRDRPGVLLPGPLRWVSRRVARRLRSYVEGGGRVASVGADTLRRAVTVAPRELVRPTLPAELDPFGARLRPLRRLEPGTALQAVEEDRSLGLLTGSPDGALEGFRLVEEAEPRTAGSAAKVRVALAADPPRAEVARAERQGELPPEPRPALTAARLGRGLVVRIGVPGWSARLQRDPEVAQITLNVVDVLRGVRPRVRSR